MSSDADGASRLSHAIIENNAPFLPIYRLGNVTSYTEYERVKHAQSEQGRCS